MFELNEKGKVRKEPIWEVVKVVDVVVAPRISGARIGITGYAPRTLGFRCWVRDYIRVLRKKDR